MDDETIEGNETVTLTVQKYTMFPTGPQYSDSLTLYDNDPTVTVVRLADAVEGGTSGTFRLTRTGSTSGTLTVTYTVETSGASVATPGDDYAALSGTVTFPIGYDAVDVSVSAYDDIASEPNETVGIVIQDSPDYLRGDLNTAELVIRDADTGVVTGRAWVDESEDGIQDEGESGLPETVVKLYQNSVLVDTTTTDERGVYTFTGVAPGAGYTVTFVPPDDVETSISPEGEGEVDTLDSDANVTTVSTAPFTVVAGATAAVVRDIGLIRQETNPTVRIDLPNRLAVYRFELLVTAQDGTATRIGPIQVSAHSAADARAILMRVMERMRLTVQSVGTTSIVITQVLPAPNVPVGMPWPVSATYKVEGGGRVPQVRKTGAVQLTVQGQFSQAAPASTTPAAYISFPTMTGIRVRVSVTTAGGQGPSQSNWITVSGDSADAVRDSVFDELPSTWTFAKAGDGLIEITKVGENPVRSVTLEYQLINLQGRPTPNAPDPALLPLLTSVGDVTVFRQRR